MKCANPECNRGIGLVARPLRRLPRAMSRCIPNSGNLGQERPVFLPLGAQAFKRDIPDADVRFFDTGHFALETHCDEIAKVIGNFLDGRVVHEHERTPT